MDIKQSEQPNKRSEPFGGIALQILCGILLIFVAIPLFIKIWGSLYEY